MSWKIAFFVSFALLLLLSAFALYSILDQAVSLQYMKDGYTSTEEDLETLINVINDTDLSRTQVETALANYSLFDILDLDTDTVSLRRVNLIFDQDRLTRVVKQW